MVIKFGTNLHGTYYAPTPPPVGTYRKIYAADTTQGRSHVSKIGGVHPPSHLSFLLPSLPSYRPPSLPPPPRPTGDELQLQVTRLTKILRCRHPNMNILGCADTHDTQVAAPLIQCTRFTQSGSPALGYAVQLKSVLRRPTIAYRPMLHSEAQTRLTVTVNRSLRCVD